MFALLDDYLTARQLAGLNDRTLRSYRRHCTHFLTWLEDRPLTRPTLRAYVAHVASDHTTVTTAAYIREVGAFLSWLVAEGELDHNPAARMKPRLPKRRPASYTATQIRRMLQGADARATAIIIVLLDTGLRAGELCSMQRSTLDWRTGHTTVVGKGNKERSVWLSTTALAAVRHYLATRRDTHPALWAGHKGALTPSGVHQLLAARAHEAHIRSDLRRLVHAFRATFAKNYIQRGGDLESLRRLLGHESIAMSAHYAQLADDELGQQKKRINPLAAILADAAA